VTKASLRSSDSPTDAFGSSGATSLNPRFRDFSIPETPSPKPLAEAWDPCKSRATSESGRGPISWPDRCSSGSNPPELQDEYYIIPPMPPMRKEVIRGVVRKSISKYLRVFTHYHLSFGLAPGWYQKVSPFKKSGPVVAQFSRNMVQ
jgi:hypothetical protein